MTNTWYSNGAYIQVPEITDLIRHKTQTKKVFPQLCNAPTGIAMGGKPKSQYTMIFYNDLTGVESLAVRRVTESQDFAKGDLTPFNVSFTVEELGYATSWSGKLEFLDDTGVVDDFLIALMNDWYRTESSLAFEQFSATSWAYVLAATPSSNEFVTDGNPTTVAASNLNFANLVELVTTAKEQNIPFWDGESYILVTTPRGEAQLKYDSSVTNLVKEDSGASALNGEVGRLGGARIVTENHKLGAMTKQSNGATLSPRREDFYLVGADAVLYEPSIPVEIRFQDGRFGRVMEAAWYFMGAYKKIHSQSVTGKEHIIRGWSD